MCYVVFFIERKSQFFLYLEYRISAIWHAADNHFLTLASVQRLWLENVIVRKTCRIKWCLALVCTGSYMELHLECIKRKNLGYVSIFSAGWCLLCHGARNCPPLSKAFQQSITCLWHLAWRHHDNWEELFSPHLRLIDDLLHDFGILMVFLNLK